MIDVKTKKCIEPNCITQPIYNIPTERHGIYCKKHKKENMINIKNKKCVHINCYKIPYFNVPSKKNAIFCFTHKTEDMVDVKSKKCINIDCNKQPSYNLPTEIKALYCKEHASNDMINVNNARRKCQHLKCKETSIFGLQKKRPQYCNSHRQPNMINLQQFNKCSILECEQEHVQIIDNTKYCNIHIPKDALTKVKRLCKYCDIKEQSDYTCNDCKKIQNKKEWAIVRYLRKAINTPFEYNSSRMLQGCSKKRPDIYFELNKHCVIVEIDENQHNSYQDSCECARINEIVNGVGGKSVIIIRYNPDTIKNKGKNISISNAERIDLLVKTIKYELIKDYDAFIVKTIQLFYNDDYEVYQQVKDENITNIVAL